MAFEAPPVGSVITDEQKDRKHPDHSEMVEKWQFWRDALECTGGFELDLHRVDRSGTAQETYRNEGKTYLVRYSRESQDKFRARAKLAYLPPYVRMRGIEPLVGFLCAKEPVRQGYPSWATNWIEEKNCEGLSFDEHMAQRALPYGMTYGWAPVVIDSDYHEEPTEADRQAKGYKHAQLRMIHSDRLRDWDRNEERNLLGIKYETDLTDWHPLDGHTEFKRIRWITKEGNWYLDEKDENRKENGYEVGFSIPYTWDEAPIAEMKILDGRGLVSGVAPMVYQLFNVLSWLSEVEIGQCFNILCLPAGQKDSAKLGVMMALEIKPEQRIPPQFIAPSAVPMDHLQSQATTLIEQIQEVFGTASIFGASAEAAATLAYRFQPTDRMLRRLFADKVRYELDVMKKLALWEGQEWPEKAHIEVPKTFDTMHVERLLEQMASAFGLGLPPTSKKVGKRKVIEVMDLKGDKEEEKQIEEELEVGVQTANMADADPTEIPPTDLQAPEGPEAPPVPEGPRR